MKEMYVTITGTRYYYDIVPFAVGKVVRCIKEPGNSYDQESIKVVMNEIGTVGYIANSCTTRIAGTISAGRIYDRVGKGFLAQVMFITRQGIICRVLDKDSAVSLMMSTPPEETVESLYDSSPAQF